MVDEKVQDYEDGNYDNDRYGSVCFHGDTRVKLSNNRSVPIKMIRPGMKVKTEQGYAKVLKVVKDGRPDGERLVKFGRLITTDNHPIKYRGQWYMAKEVGKLFQSKSLEVWNLILDKHHTIYANNVVSATLGKWDSIEQFLYQKNHRINMLRAQDEDYGGGSTGGGGGGASGGAVLSGDTIIEEWHLYNAWVKKVTLGELDYSSDDMVEISVEFRYDYAKLNARNGDNPYGNEASQVVAKTTFT